ncbi:MAG: divalent-cation tolerance protein CutA [Alphaproteobacteria bacterium]|jgi:periplasmic divalent cation tolerance protein
MSAKLVYITTPSEAEAIGIGRALVTERLAACVNVHGRSKSIFRWEDEIQESEEFVLIAKTSERRTDLLVEKVIELHSYDCPCIVVTPIVGGNAEFLAWIIEETE